MISRIYDKNRIVSDSKLSRFKQVFKNKWDFRHIKKIGKNNRYVRKNFYEENYKDFLRYITSFLELYEETEEGTLYSFVIDITPEELRMLGREKPYVKTILGETRGILQYAIMPTPLLSTIVKTRGIPNRETIVKMITDYPDVWQFNHVAYENEYIDAFCLYVRKLSEFLNPPNSVDFDVFRFHPILYSHLYNNFDEVFEEKIENGCAGIMELPVKHLKLTKVGESLLSVSNKISKNLGEERDYRRF